MVGGAGEDENPCFDTPAPDSSVTGFSRAASQISLGLSRGYRNLGKREGGRGGKWRCALDARKTEQHSRCCPTAEAARVIVEVRFANDYSSPRSRRAAAFLMHLRRLSSFLLGSHPPHQFFWARLASCDART